MDEILIYIDNIMKAIGSISLELLSGCGKAYLLIVAILCFCSCNSMKRQQKNGFVKYDSLTQKMVYVFVERMPSYIGGEAAFISDFNKRFFFHPF